MRKRRLLSHHLSVVAALGAAATLVGCSQTDLSSGFDSPYPAARLYAINQAARTDDSSSRVIRELVISLGSNDPVERMLAIDALESITGETYGYRHYDPLINRQAAINRWLVWLDAQEETPVTPLLIPTPMTKQPVDADDGTSNST